MKKLLKKGVSALLALTLMLSATGTAISAAQLGDDAGEAAIAEVGAASPVITSVTPDGEGITLAWSALSTSSAYRVYRWYDDGRGWVKLQDTKELSYKDKNVVSGVSYTYRLVGLDASGNVNSGTVNRTVTYYAPVKLTDIESEGNGIRVYWNSGTKAERVAVYRMENNSWKRIATAAGSSYLDTDVTYRNEYRYTIRGLDSSGAFIDDYYDARGLSLRHLPIPSVRAETAVGGIKLSWDEIEGAEGYRIFYKNSSGGWSRMATTTAASYLDDDVRSGNSYTYTVRCITADGEYYTSFFDTSGKTARYVAAPELISAQGTADGIRISWKPSTGAVKYRVFFKNSAGSWSRLGTTTETSFLDTEVASGKTYVYTVRCMDANENYISSFYGEGISGKFLSAPVVSAANGAEGVDIRWNAVDGAENYRVYYYGSRGWTKLTDTTETAFTDTDVSSNHTYTYTVRCINPEGTAFTSSYLSGKSVRYIAAPTLTATNTEDGVSLKWNAVSGAEKYRVYYYGSRGWTKMVDTASTSYLDKDVESGKNYTYTVRCINAAGNAFLSYFKPGVSTYHVTAPDFDVTLDEKSVTVSWDAIPGAELYRVYRNTASGWTRIADTTETSYVQTNVISGETYTYTVRCLNAAADTFTSDYRPGKSVRYVETPRITSVVNTPEGVGISWKAVPGAEKYRVYYQNDSGWTKLCDTTATSYVDTDVASGHTYTYTLRCVNADGTAYESSFDREGSSVDYIAAPRDLKADSEGNGIKISWKHSEGAEKYRVYYYGSRGWTMLEETADNTVVDTDVVSGYTYTYTVRCINADGNRFTSDFDHDGVAYKYTEIPTLLEPDYTYDGSEGIEISWNPSRGAEKYRVYYYGSRGWTKMAETTDTSYIDDDIESGHRYRYTVRCVTADGNSFTSDCDTTGVSIYYVSPPRLLNAETDLGTVKLTWSKPSGAARYRVYKRVSGSWRRLGDTTSNTYTDNDVTTGETYKYAVRVVSSDGEDFYSGFDPDGFVVTVVAQTSDFVYYDQGDYSYPYGDDTIAYSGCGPTCFAMIASTILGRRITPIDAVKWCGNSYYVYNVGTRWDYFTAASDHFGIKMEKQLSSSQFSSVITALKQGKYVISAQSAGIFTSGGHFIVLSGITSDGRIIVYDPNGGNHYAGTKFAQSSITASGTQYWVFDKK